MNVRRALVVASLSLFLSHLSASSKLPTADNSHLRLAARAPATPECCRCGEARARKQTEASACSLTGVVLLRLSGGRAGWLDTIKLWMWTIARKGNEKDKESEDSGTGTGTGTGAGAGAERGREGERKREREKVRLQEGEGEREGEEENEG
eukprot:766441-Hanusia_phi.AAC.1